MQKVKYLNIHFYADVPFYDQQNPQQIYSISRDDLIKVRKLTNGKWGDEIKVSPEETVLASEITLVGPRDGYENVDEYRITSEHGFLLFKFKLFKFIYCLQRFSTITVQIQCRCQLLKNDKNKSASLSALYFQSTS